MNRETRLQHAANAERGSLADGGKLLRELADPQAPVPMPAYAMADLPAAALYPHCAVICTDGGGGDACLAVSDGADWLNADGSALDDGSQ